MPPVRTQKSSPSSAVKGDKMWLKPMPKGLDCATFNSSEHDWDGKYKNAIGMSTKTIKFDYQFILTDSHIDDILAIGKAVCKNLQHFIFEYSDVSYGATNNAESLTNEAVARLAKACPNLKTLRLPATSKVGDEGLLALFQGCPALTTLEVTEPSRGSAMDVSEKTMDELRENPQWVPKLKLLMLSERDSNKPFMKAMRELTRARKGLTVRLTCRSEEKKWGDWELETSTTDYKNGRKKSDDYQGPGFISDRYDFFPRLR